jgi:hypothetical protein
MTSSQPKGRSRVMAGKPAPAVAGVRSDSSTYAVPESVPAEGEVLGMGLASFVLGAPAEIVSPPTGSILAAAAAAACVDGLCHTITAFLNGGVRE